MQMANGNDRRNKALDFLTNEKKCYEMSEWGAPRWREELCKERKWENKSGDRTKIQFLVWGDFEGKMRWKRSSHWLVYNSINRESLLVISTRFWPIKNSPSRTDKRKDGRTDTLSKRRGGLLAWALRNTHIIITHMWNCWPRCGFFTILWELAMYF